MNATPYPWQELKFKWEKETVTTEQVIGQLLVWGENTYTQLVACQRQLESRQRQVDELLARMVEWEKRQEQVMRTLATMKKGE